MKKKEMVERIGCDFCGGEAHALDRCLLCGQDICWDCKKTKAREYHHAVYFSGSGDGTYCLDCDAKLRKSNDPLHSAYRAIEGLRNEYQGWVEDFDKRKKEAEARLKALRPKR
ncbi:MAG: hypothetical protein WC736_15545 [Gallionella sp.]|jgi:hypothetical protein